METLENEADSPMPSDPLAEPLGALNDAAVVVGEPAFDEGDLGGVDLERGGDLDLGESPDILGGGNPELLATSDVGLPGGSVALGVRAVGLEWSPGRYADTLTGNRVLGPVIWVAGTA